MAAEQSKPKGPDLAQGVALGSLVDGGMIGGHVGDDAVLLIRRGDELFAIGATCTHYGGPLAEGLVVGDTVRCPWHHACFSLRTGEVLRAPALDALTRWRVEVVSQSVQESKETLLQGRIYVREKMIAEPSETRPTRSVSTKSVVIIGGGVAGNMAAETLRHEGYT